MSELKSDTELLMKEIIANFEPELSLDGGDLVRVQKIGSTICKNRFLEIFKAKNPELFNRFFDANFSDSYNNIYEALSSLDQSEVSSDFAPILPPEDIHLMARKNNVVWDLKNCDYFSYCLKDTGIDFPKTGGRYLDFGCSSGRTIRTMATCFPDADWVGCDPVQASISWAQNNIPNASFFTSSSIPGENDFDEYDGVVAFSVWSHFSPTRAQEWLEKFSQAIKPDGFILMSVHSPFTLAKYTLVERFAPKYLAGILKSLKETGTFFDPAKVRQKEKQADGAHWGRAFYTEKAFSELCNRAGWDVKSRHVGMWGDKQDVYILQHRS